MPLFTRNATARELLAELEAMHSLRVTTELQEVDLVHKLCLAYDTVDEDAFGEAAERLTHYGADGTPPVAEFLSLEIAALLGMSPVSGACLIGDVLNCVYRRPAMWEAVQTGAVRWYRATEVIGLVNAAGLPLDAAQWVDQRIAPLLQTLPRGRAIRTLRGLIAIAAPELARERERQSREERHVTIWTPTIEAGGCCIVAGRLDVTDATALDDTLSRLAETLAAHGDTDPIDIRRATALGILAEPSRALSLLTDGTDPGSSRTTTVVLHISD